MRVHHSCVFCLCGCLNCVLLICMRVHHSSVFHLCVYFNCVLSVCMSIIPVCFICVSILIVFYLCACPSFLCFIFPVCRVSFTTDTLKQVVQKFQLSDRVLDHSGELVATVMPSMLDVLERGLGDRVTLVQPQPHPSPMVCVF